MSTVYLTFQQVWTGFLTMPSMAISCLAEWKNNACINVWRDTCMVMGIWREGEPFALEFSSPRWSRTLRRNEFTMAIRHPGAPRIHILHEGNRVMEVEFLPGSCPWADTAAEVEIA